MNPTGNALDDILAGDLAPPQALAALAIATGSASRAHAALAAAGASAPRAAARLAVMRSTAASHPDALDRILAVLAAVPHLAAGEEPEAELQRIAAGFDAAAAISPEAAAALHSLGDPALLAEATAEIVEDLARRGLVTPATRVLDLGCGAGRLAAALAAKVASVHGVDPSAGMIAAARALTAGLPNVTLTVAAGHDLADAAGPFDLAVALDSFPYVVQAGGDLPARTFAAVGRSLAPGGRFAVLNLSYRRDDAADLSDAEAWARSAGLRLEAVAPGAFTRWDGRLFLFGRSR